MGWIEITIGIVGSLSGLAAVAVLVARERKSNRRFRILAEVAAVSDAGGSLERGLWGAILSTAYVAIGRGYSAESRPRMLALLSTGWVVPGLIGPAISGLMAESLGWRSVFLALTPLPILAALLAFPSLRSIPAGTPALNARARVIGGLFLDGAQRCLGGAHRDRAVQYRQERVAPAQLRVEVAGAGVIAVAEGDEADALQRFAEGDAAAARSRGRRRARPRGALP